MDRTNPSLIQFAWSEAFNEAAMVKQSSIAFEKANVLFNLAAVLSQIGTGTTFTTTTTTTDSEGSGGHRGAALAFQASAGILRWVSENFLHPPLVDIQRGSLVHLAAVMVAQGQECIAWKAMADGKSAAILAKLAAGTRQLYLDAGEKLRSGSGGGGSGGSEDRLQKMLGSGWSGMLGAKGNLFWAFTEYYRAEIAFASESAHGEGIARLLAAQAACREGVGICDDQNGGGSFGILKAIFTRLMAVLGARLEVGQKENGLIYHQPVPPYDTLPVAEGLVLAKALSFADAVAEAKGSVAGGVDLFARLVPLRVHELVSLYSEEKSKLLRYETAKVSEADRAFQSMLTDLDFPESLERVRSEERQRSSTAPLDASLLPSGIGECKAQLSRMPPIAVLLEGCREAEGRAKGLFAEIDRILEADKTATLRITGKTAPSLDPTQHAAAAAFYQRMGEIEKRLALIVGETPSLVAQYKTIQEDIDLLNMPSDREILTRLRPINTTNLLEDDDSSSNRGKIVEKIEEMLGQLEEQQRQRNAALEQLQQQVQ